MDFNGGIIAMILSCSGAALQIRSTAVRTYMPTELFQMPPQLDLDTDLLLSTGAQPDTHPHFNRKPKHDRHYCLRY